LLLLSLGAAPGRTRRGARAHPGLRELSGGMGALRVLVPDDVACVQEGRELAPEAEDLGLDDV
jgi:hypothetical protein